MVPQRMRQIDKLKAVCNCVFRQRVDGTSASRSTPMYSSDPRNVTKLHFTHLGIRNNQITVLPHTTHEQHVHALQFAIINAALL